MSRQVVLWINLSGSKWDKQFYLELAQLLAQQLSTLISRFLDKGKVEFGNLLSAPLSHSCSGKTAGAGEVWSDQENEKAQIRRRRNRRWCGEVCSDQEREKVKPQVLLSGDRRPLIPDLSILSCNHNETKVSQTQNKILGKQLGDQCFLLHTPTS